mmetsp:Transcript_28479/g.80186  ORF Transcript_28479/g.80186 Transcript_28479/m.80186 type:complete len:93 (+) Transcript_28479:737-1015(+)
MPPTNTTTTPNLLILNAISEDPDGAADATRMQLALWGRTEADSHHLYANVYANCEAKRPCHHDHVPLPPPDANPSRNPNITESVFSDRAMMV